MLDLAKRRTLKLLSSLGLGAYSLTHFPAHAGLDAGAARVSPPVSTNTATELPLTRITLDVRVSALTNDLEVVMKNEGDETALITHMTPRRIEVGRGQFDFERLLERGPFRLRAGESVSVPLQPYAQPHAEWHPVHRRMAAHGSLLDTLRQTVTVVSDNNAFASVTIRPETAVA